MGGLEHELPRPGEPPARGRRAQTPFEIPWPGWKDLLVRVFESSREDKLGLVAAGVTFYAALALAPALVALVAIYGLVASPSDVAELLGPLVGLMPSSGARLVQEVLADAVEAAPESLTIKGIFAIGLSLWSANRGMRALLLAIGVTYDEDERLPVWREFGRGLVGCVLGVVVLAATGTLLFALPALLRSSGGGGLAEFVTQGRIPALFIVLTLGISALYRWGPVRRAPQWRWVWLGAVAATFVWLLLSFGISLYFRHGGSGFETGAESLDAVIAMLLWVYAGNLAVLVGAELNAEIEHQTVIDSTIGEARPLGQRDAHVADHIGSARSQ